MRGDVPCASVCSVVALVLANETFADALRSRQQKLEAENSDKSGTLT